MRWVQTRSLAIVSAASALLAGCGVSQEKYDALKAQNDQQAAENAQLRQQLAATGARSTRLENTVRYTVNSELLFSPGSWTITPDGQQIMAKVAQQLGPNQERKLIIQGHTDNQPVGASLKRAGVDSNETLSVKRAEAVKDFLVQHGAKADMVSVQGLGESHPVATNDTPEGRAQNRRVEIAVAPE
jgi:chemotaxis protein MotB